MTPRIAAVSSEIPDPATRSFTTLETWTSPRPARAATRAPIWTAIPSALNRLQPVWSARSHHATVALIRPTDDDDHAHDAHGRTGCTAAPPAPARIAGTDHGNRPPAENGEPATRRPWRPPTPRVRCNRGRRRRRRRWGLAARSSGRGKRHPPTAARRSAADQPGNPTSAPTARPSPMIHVVIAAAQAAITTILATTITRRRRRRQKPANGSIGELAAEYPGRQEGEQDRSADGHACPSSDQKVGQSAVPAVSWAFAPSSPSERAASGSLRMTMNRPVTSGAT